jgi:hypothetical protein
LGRPAASQQAVACCLSIDTDSAIHATAC